MLDGRVVVTRKVHCREVDKSCRAQNKITGCRDLLFACRLHREKEYTTTSVVENLGELQI